MKAPVAAVPVTDATAIADDIMTVKGIYVKQKIELIEALTGYETQNKYKVFTFLEG